MRSPELITQAIVEAALGALQRRTYPRRNVVNNKSFHHPQNDLEGALIELGATFTPTRTTGREIGLHQGCSGAGTVGDHAIGMTSTAPGADVHRNR